VATLVVVMLLFFLLALASAYTNRNLIFEQKTSSNLYRSTQAFEAAEAGLEWALAQLNGGRINARCEAGADTDLSFRDRYLGTFAVDGTISPPKRTDIPTRPLLPACVFNGTAWLCNCPTQGPSLPDLTGADDLHAFRLQFTYVGWPGALLASVPPGVVQVISTGFSRCGGQCLADTPGAPSGDAMAVVTAVVALRSGLATPPGAALTVQGALDHTGANSMRVINSGQDGGSATVEIANGVTVQAGGAVGTARLALESLPGTPSERSLVQNDNSFAAQGLDQDERMFVSVFGVTSDLYRQQPGSVVLDCTIACDAAKIQTAATKNPGRVLWAQGNVNVNGDIGSAAIPVVLVATGPVRLASGIVYGLVYSRAEPTWAIGDDPTDAGEVHGAVVAQAGMNGQGRQLVQYNGDVLKRLRTRYGSLVRIPGGWKDF
jgi:hypothetical protein